MDTFNREKFLRTTVLRHVHCAPLGDHDFLNKVKVGEEPEGLGLHEGRGPQETRLDEQTVGSELVGVKRWSLFLYCLGRDRARGHVHSSHEVERTETELLAELQGGGVRADSAVIREGDGRRAIPIV